jgi:2-polyprenyl-3-methyl-5-hydroxy-6-metoxy-1,4-benzoquinol methylase
MPKSAQNFPRLDQADQDSPIDLDLRQCMGCGLVQLANDPVPYYREVIRASAFSSEMGEFRRQQFAEFVARFDLHGQRAIEIGCGRGEYMHLLQDQGLRITGLEYAHDAVSACLENGLDVHQGFMESSDLVVGGGQFSACFMFNFLEHLPSLNDTLQGIAANLAEGAVGLIEVPNFDMILREDMFTEFCSDHLFYFTRDTFAHALARNGFEVLECEVIWHEYIISATVRKRAPISMAGFIDAKGGLAEGLHQYLAEFAPMSVAVWGAGHQALAVMAAAGLHGKIACVIDSAPFKQNRLTPATHVPILAPDVLASSPVKAIIVMAAAYSDEIVGQIARQYGSRFDVVVLRGQSLERVIKAA